LNPPETEHNTARVPDEPLSDGQAIENIIAAFPVTKRLEGSADA
jgi:hypothetical protein